MERDSVTKLVMDNVEALIDARSTNPAEVARKAGLNYTAVYDIIKGKVRSPRVETLDKIAKALGVPIATLFEDASDEQLRSEIVAIYHQLPEAEQRRLVVTAKAWLGEGADGPLRTE